MSYNNVIDRDSRQLTTTGPRMLREAPPPPTHDSIFGDTVHGVPNPEIPFKHAWPTRYHGPVFLYPQPGWGYAKAEYAQAPFLGLGLDALGYQPRSLTGSQVVDTLLGAVLGYIAAPNKEHALLHAVAGGAAGGFFGGVGLAGLLAIELVMQHKEAGQRDDLPALLGGK